MYDYSKPTLEMKPDQLVIHVGTNDLKKTSNNDEIVDNIVKLALHCYNSNEIPVVISSLTYRDDNFKDRIGLINDQLKAKCEERNIGYIDNSNIGKFHLNRRKLHLNAKGIATLAKNFKMKTKDFYEKSVLENQHITTHYFAARTINYYNTVMRTLLQSDTFWFRFEFAKGRGQIHSHGVLFSEQHAKIVEDCLNCGEEDKANQLYNWLQSETNNTDEIFSPMFTSLHPAGGSEVIGENGEREWIPNKEGWAPPEGTRNPPEYDPLGVPILQTCNEENDLNELHTDITNMVALHSCNGYCLKKKNKDSERRYCRAHFGKEDPITKKTPGKELHPFEARIEGDGHPRYEGPRDHARMLNHIKTLLIAWQANCDCQALIDQDLLNLVKYICSYCCKGATTTEEFVTIYGELLHSSDISTTIKNVAQRLLMKVVGVVDVPAAAADFINTGGHLYHSTNLTQRVGLSGYRQLNSKKSNGSEYATVETPLDKFLRQERREEDPEMTLYDWAKKCRCNYPCGRDHIPLFTGTDVKPIWPLSEDCCKSQLMIYSKGTWESPEDLKDEDEQFSDALAAFLNDDPDCPDFLKEIIYLSKLKYDKKQERERRRNRNRNDENQIQESQDVQLSQPASQDSQQSSQDSNYNDLRLGEALLRDIRLNNNVNFDSIIGEANLFDGGPEFDWNAYAKECFGSDDWPENTKTWLQDKYEEVEERITTHLNNYNLPVINLLYANPLQRVIIAMNLEKLLSVAAGTDNSEPLRLLVQGYGGTGKTFTINAITYITRRLFRRNGSTLNIAPTGAASNLIPDGRTLHSTTPIPFMTKKERSTVDITSHPMNSQQKRKLQTLIGFNNETQNHGLYTLNMDERSMYSPRLLAWCNQRFMEATEDFEKDFGNIPREDFDNGRVITLNETWQEVFDENREKLSRLRVPVATIPCTEGRGTCHKTSGQKQMGQIPGISFIAVGCPVMLTKNQGPLTTFGLNNGAIGTVIAILYPDGCCPPSPPDAIIVHFEGYNGPVWNEEHPKWVPIVPMKSRCDAHQSCSRTGFPLLAAYSIPIAKSQGMTIGEGKPATHMRVKLQQKTFMESLSLGTTYTALSRVESDKTVVSCR
ncbi:uncharacterized protein [Clytia hemisphaerica]|uniref:uncharacterized protein n=1 Tax=Clytia hemisphaerica TaxID=252671 RepID=UPI0034D73E55